MNKKIYIKIINPFSFYHSSIVAYDAYGVYDDVVCVT